jgi:hypothetical protein
MDTIDEIKLRVAQLSRDQEADLLAWMADRHHEDWDKQIEADLESGCLDDVLAEARADMDAGRGRDL